MDEVKDILRQGEQRGKEIAEQTMEEVHKKMKLG
jgi:hypothetical protein